jgi:hypothetical protein
LLSINEGTLKKNWILANTVWYKIL